MNTFSAFQKTPPSSRQRYPQVLSGILLVAFASISFAAPVITLDGRKEGRRFDGIGAVSGGGATSRFLREYPEPQRSQILDYLFKPNFGASLQVLYVEMGSDKNGTQGSEPSHARTREELLHPKAEYYQRGYEWWLMTEAKKRNPDIRFDVAAWNAPVWMDKVPGGFWSKEMCDYYVAWIKGAKQYYGLDVGFTGCRNESGVNIPWVKQYRAALDAAGLNNVVIHGFDNWRPETKWLFAKELATDAELNNAVGIISSHTTWKGAPEGVSPSPDYVLNSGKPIWDTEEHVYQAGYPGCINKVEASNENYIDNKITSTVFWHLITAYYRAEGFYGKHAMAIADEPWSGNYTIQPELWGHAHTCQFTKIGWKYLDGEGCGYFKDGGSWVTYKSPNGTDFTVVIETKNAKVAQTVVFKPTGGLSTGPLAVWFSDEANQFQQLAALKPVGGSVELTLKPNSIYTLTTLTGQKKGTYPAPPASKAFPFPYHEDYDHDTKVGAVPRYHSDIQGVFEVAERPDGKGRCLQAIVPFNSTKNQVDGFTVVGDGTWRDFRVAVEVSLSATGGAALLGRVTSTLGKFCKGYVLKLTADGAWMLLAGNESLAKGTVSLATTKWQNLELIFAGTSITASINGTQVAAVTHSGFAAGLVGLGTCMSTPRFDNLCVDPSSVQPMKTTTNIVNIGKRTPEGRELLLFEVGTSIETYEKKDIESEHLATLAKPISTRAQAAEVFASFVSNNRAIRTAKERSKKEPKIYETFEQGGYFLAVVDWNENTPPWLVGVHKDGQELFFHGANP